MDQPPSSFILGIDPGTNIMGFGILEKSKSKFKVVQYGIIRLQSYTNHALKLKAIYRKIAQLINEYNPDEVALESPFYGKNVQSMLKLGRAQGVAMAAALSYEVPVVEYTPKEIKKAVTGNGNATKQQVAHMLCSLLNIKEVPKLFDASDALGVAWCHAIKSTSTYISKCSINTWESYVKSNTHRIK